MPDLRPVCFGGTAPRPGSRLVSKRSAETDTLRTTAPSRRLGSWSPCCAKLIAAAQVYFDTELDAAEAASETGRCEETIRRAVRDGTIRTAAPTQRPPPRAPWRLQKLAAPSTGPYDPDADAQDIARTPEEGMKHRKCWSKSIGERGARVRLYEDRPGGPLCRSVYVKEGRCGSRWGTATRSWRSAGLRATPLVALERAGVWTRRRSPLA